MSTATFTHDVVLSRSGKDKPVVRPQAKRWRKERLRVWFDEWEVAKSESIRRKRAPQV